MKPEGEMVRTPLDRHQNMPRESLRRSNGNPPRQPAMWAFTSPVEVLDEPEPIYGRYPKGFLARVIQGLGVNSAEVLHVCSGAMSRDDALGGVRVDIRLAARPDVLADGRRLPFRDDAFAAVFIDPPYSVEYAETLYGVKYPRPSHLLREAARVVRPSGVVGLLHYLVAMPPEGCKIQSVRGVTTGLGYRIRAWVEYRKEQASLFEIPKDGAE